jgi:hypothetical protein
LVLLTQIFIGGISGEYFRDFPLPLINRTFSPIVHKGSEEIGVSQKAKEGFFPKEEQVINLLLDFM